jgi:hypothetical protein
MWDVHPCDGCQKILNDGGHFIIETRDGESGDNPYRTGRYLAVTHEAAERLFTLRPVPRVAYMEHSAYEQVFGEALKDNG